MKTDTKQLKYLLLTFLTIVIGYIYLRYAYKVTDSMPFTQEIVLIILGTITTVFITSLLLNKQTEVEIEKEQNIRFLELKTKTYERLLDLMEDMSIKENISENSITKLQFITHRLAIFASPDVLNEYNNFLNVISKISQDGSFNDDDMHKLSEALGQLTIQIRFDLLNENNTTKTSYSLEQIKKMIKRNSNDSSNINIQE
jgi:type II secretory pathway pseudopilin PulG